MKTLRLTKPESAGYTAGERRFWLAIKPQPETRPGRGLPHVEGVWMKAGWNLLNPIGLEWAIKKNPYGKPGDRIEIRERGWQRSWLGATRTITAITVEQRNGRWGWLLEVGA